MSTRAMAMSDAAGLERWAKIAAATAAVLGAAWAVCSRVWRRFVEYRRRRAVERKAIRYLLDAQRHTLAFVVPMSDRYPNDVEEMVRQKALVDQVRDQLWIADGHAAERGRDELAGEIRQWLTRTQAIQLKRTRQGRS